MTPERLEGYRDDVEGWTNAQNYQIARDLITHIDTLTAELEAKALALKCRGIWKRVW